MGSWAAILLSRRERHGWRATMIRALLIIVWHWTILPLSVLFWEWRGQGGGAISWEAISGGFLSLLQYPSSMVLLSYLLCEGLLSWAFFRVLARRLQSPFSLFIRYWWLLCLWGALALPAAAAALGQASLIDDGGAVLVLVWAACTIVAPGLRLRSELKGADQMHACRICGAAKSPGARGRCARCGVDYVGLRLSRWRPVCPECGYALRGLRGSRCPECGIDLPATATTFRRWAVHRLPWDRARRVSVVGAYVKTLCSIVFTPTRAARRLTLPDRWGRTARWAAAHLLLAMFAAALLGTYQQYMHAFINAIWPPAFQPPHLLFAVNQPLDRVFVWLANALLANAAAMLLIVAIGCGISYFTPGRHRAAKRAGVKWSLYLAPLLLLTLIGWYGFHFAFPQHGRSAPPMSFTYRLPIPEVPVWLLAAVYGAYWALGIAIHPYNRLRGSGPVLGYALIFACAWLLLALLLFAPGPLEVLR